MQTQNLPLYNPDGKYELPKMMEPQEKPLTIPKQANVVLQPKFDGCQAIFIPVNKDGKVVYEPVTRKGNVISRLRKFSCSLDLNSINNPVLFSEFEPVPWSDTGKVKLAGNLYNEDKLEFETRLVIFDMLDNSSFYSNEMKNSSTKQRLIELDEAKTTILSSCNQASELFEISPWQEMTYEESLNACRSSRIETKDGTRCNVLGILCEGGIVRYENKAQKEKPTIDKDIVILSAIKSPKGQIGWIGLDTKDPTENGLMLVYGGVTEDIHKAMVGKVVEVNMLVVSGFKGAGNPTYTRSRENEKEFDGVKYYSKLHKQISKLKGKNKELKSLDNSISL